MNPSVLLAVFLWAHPCRAADLAPDAPFNLNSAPADMKAKVEKLRSQFQMTGYRFDDDDGTILTPRIKPGPDGKDVHDPATNKEIDAVLSEFDKGTDQMALARIAELVKGQDPAKPLSADKIKILQDLVATNKEFLAPKIVADIEAASKGPAGSLGADALSAYEEMTRYFDGKASLQDFANNTTPVTEGWSKKPQLPGYFNTDERELGNKVTSALTAKFQQTKTGRELLGNFTDDKGVVKLPDMLVLKIDDFAAAVYSGANRAVICNFSGVKQAVVDNAPLGQQMELQGRLKTPKDLNDYLSKDPKALDAFIGQYDVAFYHELTHAWQDKRGTIEAERARGNVPPTDPMEWEWEAFRNQNRYFHEKLLTDPGAAMRSPWLDGYRQMLADFPAWQDSIARQYMEGMPAGITTLSEMRRLQDLRREATLDESHDGLASVAKSFLKVLGLNNGDTAIAAAKTDLDARTEKFKKEELPGMRVDGFLALSDAFGKRLDYRQAFQSAVAAENFAKGTPLEKKASAGAQGLSDKAVAWVRAGKGDPDSLAAALSAVTTRNAERNAPALPGQNDLVLTTFLRVVDSHLDASRRSTALAVQQRERATAQAYVDALKTFKPNSTNDPALRKRLIEARAAFGLDKEGKP